MAAYRQAFPTATVDNVVEVNVADQAGRLLAGHDVQTVIRERDALATGPDTVWLEEVICKARDLFDSAVAEGWRLSRFSGRETFRPVAEAPYRRRGPRSGEQDCNPV